MGLFGCDETGKILTDFATLTRHGLQAQALQRTTTLRDRGLPLTPLGGVVDLHLGYGTAGVSNASWSVLPLSAHDRMLDDLVRAQLYRPSGAPDDVLQTTLHGEVADVMLSDSPADYLALYPVLLLVGDQHFGDGLAERLLSALRAGAHELVVQPFHLTRMGQGMVRQLNGTGKLTVVSPPPLRSTGRTPAIAPADLDGIARKHLPAVVANATLLSGEPARIVCQVNSQLGGGFVLELSNPHGVGKSLCSPMTLDPHGAVRVSVVLWGPRRAAGP